MTEVRSHHFLPDAERTEINAGSYMIFSTKTGRWVEKCRSVCKIYRPWNHRWVSDISYTLATRIEIYPVDFRAVLASLCPVSRFLTAIFALTPNCKNNMGGYRGLRLFV